jgi:hypothetical protein
MERTRSYTDAVKGRGPETKFDLMLKEARNYRAQDTEMKQVDAELALQTILEDPNLTADKLHPLKPHRENHFLKDTVEAMRDSYSMIPRG